MAKIIPKEIVSLCQQIKKINNATQKLREDIPKYEKRFQEKSKELAIKNNFPVSLSYSRKIFKWVEGFLEDENYKKNRKLFTGEYSERVRFFGANFFNFLPAKGRTTRTVLYFCEDGSLEYEEFFKAWVRTKVKIFSPQEMAQKLHPKFIKECYSYLSSGKIWEYIKEKLIDRQKGLKADFSQEKADLDEILRKLRKIEKLERQKG